MSLGLLGAYISSDSDSSSEDESKSNEKHHEDELKNKKIAFSNPFNNGGSTDAQNFAQTVIYGRAKRCKV